MIAELAPTYRAKPEQDESICKEESAGEVEEAINTTMVAE